MALPLLAGLLTKALVSGGKGLSASLTTNFNEKFNDQQINAIIDDVAAEMLERVIRRTTRVDTGAMQGGWRIETGGGSGSYSFALSNPVDYTIHHEYGTYKMTAIPMMRPTLEEAQDILDEAVEKHK